MKPKKKSIFPAIIYGLCLLFVLYISLHAAAAYENTEKMINKGKIEKSSQMYSFMGELSDRFRKNLLILKEQNIQKELLCMEHSCGS